MDIKSFIQSFLHALSDIDFIDGVELHSEAFIIKGRVSMKKGRFLQIYLNEKTGTIAFALIEAERRIWGVDSNNMSGWHMHPVEKPEEHIDCQPMSAETLVEQIKKAWGQIP